MKRVLAKARRVARRAAGWRLSTLATKLATIGVVCGLFLVGAFDGLERFIEDQRFAVATRPATGQLLLVDIDAASIHALGAWPWSRSIHARIVDALVALGAADIAFDVDFSSPSTDEGDAAFEQALKRADGSVVLASFRQAEDIGSARPMLIESRPIARFAANCWAASVNVQPAEDGRVRQLLQGEAFGSTGDPALAAVLGTRQGSITGSFLIDYGIDYRQVPHVTVFDLLRGAVDPALVRDHKVIVGASAVELKDIFQVPRFGFMPGSAVQAMAAESLLQGRALMPVARWLVVAITSLLLGAVCIGARRISFRLFVLLCVAVAIGAEAVATMLQATHPLIAATAPVHVGAFALALAAAAEQGVQRRFALLATRRSGNRLRVMLDRVIADNFDGIVIVDQSGQICAQSAAASAIFDLPHEPAIACLFRDVVPPSLATLVDEALAALRDGVVLTPSRCEIVLERQGRPAVLLDCVTTTSEFDHAACAGPSVRNDHAVCLTFRDITAERQAHQRLAELARIDTLSGLANRSVLLAAADKRRNPQADEVSALILFDIDRFKLINDRLGHAAGDDLIRAVAVRLRAAAGIDDVAARLGGDEFALIVDRPTRPAVEAFVAELARTLSGKYATGPYQHALTFSIGFTFFDGQGTREIMGCADAALHATKAAGGAGVRFYDAVLQAKVEDGRRIAEELRDAIEQEQLEVFYQRQVDAVSGRIVGVKALARWRHPLRGYISPGRFIPVAERIGLIDAIGTWVLATACREALAWPEPIKVSVNVSAIQLARRDLADRTLAILAESGLPTDRLDLELTESILMDDDDLITGTLGQLRAAGVKISLDDFGTGYSSLNYLNRLPIDKIKIDQSFVRTLADTPSAQAIVRAIVSLARELGLRVNAEGVETTEQLQVLRQIGCDEIQGFLHGRPEPSAAIVASLLQQRGSTPPLAAE